jgi:hypothetical protein
MTGPRAHALLHEHVHRTGHHSMISRAPIPPGPHAQTGLAVDHVGVVVHDLAREIGTWRELGFSVSDPVPLMGADTAGRPVPLGQSSAHVVFENGYVELSSPVPGSGNHLERYLAAGEGVRILVLAASDAAAARDAVAPARPDCAATRPASRTIRVAGRDEIARFVWFPLPVDVVPDVLSAVVEHRTPEFVFHASLVDHSNGARRIARFLVRGDAGALALPALPRFVGRDVPELARCGLDGAPVLTGFVLAGAADDGRDEIYFSLLPPAS